MRNEEITVNTVEKIDGGSKKRTKLTKLEKETIINFNEKGDCAEIYTFNSVLKKRLAELAKQRPSECYKTSNKKYDGATYTFPLGWVRINPPRKISEDHKLKLIENFRN